MRKATLSVAVLCLTQWAQAQVSNQVQVYVRPGTEVHVFENMTFNHVVPKGLFLWA